ncbi:MAG: tRNA (adenosine(37)-N6)-dimethylallyltransferase MiaA [Bacteroidales bacterium]
MKIEQPGKTLKVIVGPTASGKTDYSIELANQYNSPIISCDSRQIYKELKIGTAPPSEEQLAKIKHYFIFSHSIFDFYTAGKYELEALELINNLFLTHDTLIVVGGSGLYVDALCYGIDDFPDSDMILRDNLMQRLSAEGIESLRNELRLLDPESYETIDKKNPQRIVRALEVCLQTGKKFSSFKSSSSKQRNFTIERTIIERPREELYDRINLRVDKMIESGLIDEAKELHKFKDLPALKTVGYKELFDYFDGKTSLEEAIDLIKRNTRRYAKRQITWFKRTR